MKLIPKSWALFALVLLVAPAVANADGVGVCNNCTPVQMQEQAAGVNTDTSIVHMLDLVQGAYKTYFVEIISEPGFSQTLVREMPTAPDVAVILQNTLDLADFLIRAKDVSVAQLPLPNPPGSAIDLAANPTEAGGVVHALGLWLGSSGTSGSIVAVTNVLARLTGLVTGNILTVRFPDGTTAQLQVTNITTDENGNPVVLVKMTGLFRSDNRPIPTSASDMNGMDVTASDQAEFDRWVNLMRRLGIPIVGGGGQAPGGVPLPARFECQVEGNQIVCRVVYPT